MEKETELPSVPQAELKIPRLPSFEMIDEDYERATEAGWINESPKLLAMLNCRERQLLAAEAREAELKAEITMWRNRYEIMLHQRDKLQDAILLQEPRMEALERSHKALLGMLVESQESIGGDWRERREIVIAAAEKL